MADVFVNVPGLGRVRVPQEAFLGELPDPRPPLPDLPEPEPPTAAERAYQDPSAQFLLGVGQSAAATGAGLLELLSRGKKFLFGPKETVLDPAAEKLREFEDFAGDELVSPRGAGRMFGDVAQIGGAGGLARLGLRAVPRGAEVIKATEAATKGSGLARGLVEGAKAAPVIGLQEGSAEQAGIGGLLSGLFGGTGTVLKKVPAAVRSTQVSRLATLLATGTRSTATKQQLTESIAPRMYDEGFKFKSFSELASKAETLKGEAGKVLDDAIKTTPSLTNAIRVGEEAIKKQTRRLRSRAVEKAAGRYNVVFDSLNNGGLIDEQTHQAAQKALNMLRVDAGVYRIGPNGVLEIIGSERALKEAHKRGDILIQQHFLNTEDLQHAKLIFNALIDSATGGEGAKVFTPDVISNKQLTMFRAMSNALGRVLNSKKKDGQLLIRDANAVWGFYKNLESIGRLAMAKNMVSQKRTFGEIGVLGGALVLGSEQLSKHLGIDLEMGGSLFMAAAITGSLLSTIRNPAWVTTSAGVKRQLAKYLAADRTGEFMILAGRIAAGLSREEEKKIEKTEILPRLDLAEAAARQ